MTERTARVETQINFNRAELIALKSTSQKIRFLAALGYSRSEISDMLFVRYQHVRNVLNTKLKGE